MWDLKKISISFVIFLLLYIPAKSQITEFKSGVEYDLKSYLQNNSCEETNATSANHREFRTPKNVEECVIDMDVMLELMKLLQEAHEAVTIPEEMFYKAARQQTQDECSSKVFSEFKRSSLSISPECQLLIGNMKGLLKNITEEIKLLIEIIIIEPGDYPIVIGQLLEQIRRLNGQICDMELDHSQELEDMRQKLLNQQQCFLAKLKVKDDEISKLKFSLDEERLRAMVSKLRAGMLGPVLSDFLRQNNNSILEPLITQTYSPEYLIYIAQFARLLPNDHQRFTVYNATYFSMGNSGHFITSNIIIFRKILRDDPLSSAKDIIDKVNIFSSAVIASWGTAIRSRNATRIRPIIEFGSPPTDTFVGRCFTETISEIVVSSYANSRGNVLALTQFLKLLRWNIHKYTAVNEMTRLFTNRDDKLQVAFKARDIMGNLDGPDLNVQVIQALYEQYKNSLPQNIRYVIWHNSCYLRNRAVGYNYLYTYSASQGTDMVDNPVSTRANPSGNDKWKIEAYLENDEYRFRIRNVNTNEYFGAQLSYNEVGGSAGYCSTSKAFCFDNRFYNWKIEYHNSNDNEISLYHLGRRGFLYGSTTTPYILLTGGTSNYMFWVLECD